MFTEEGAGAEKQGRPLVEEVWPQSGGDRVAAEGDCVGSWGFTKYET